MTQNLDFGLEMSYRVSSLLFKCIFPLGIFPRHFLDSHRKVPTMTRWIYNQVFFFFEDWSCFVGSLLFVIWILRQTSLTPIDGLFKDFPCDVTAVFWILLMDFFTIFFLFA